MAKEQVKRKVMKIEDIHKYENLLFWVERLAIATLIFFPTINSYLSNIAAFFLMNAVDAVYFLLTLERQQIRRFFFEPDLIFYVERVTIKYWLFFYNYRDTGFAPGSGIALAIVIFTNLLMLKDTLKDLVKYLAKISSSSHSSNTSDAKVDQKKEENAKGINVELLEKEVELKQEGEGEGEFVILQEGNYKGESAANDDEGFLDYLSVLDSSVPAKGDKVEAALPRCSTPSARPYPFNPLNIELPVTSRGWFVGDPFFSGKLPEHSSARMVIQREDQEASVAGSYGLPYYNNFFKEDLFSFNQEIPNEQVEAKDGVQEAASSNYKSDGDSSWEEVQNSVGAEIADPDQKKTDELEESGEVKEGTSSWEAGERSNLFIQEQLHEWKQREEERAERLHELQQMEEERAKQLYELQQTRNELAEQLRGYEAMFLMREQQQKEILADDLEQQEEDTTEELKQQKEDLTELLEELEQQKEDLSGEIEQLEQHKEALTKEIEELEQEEEDLTEEIEQQMKEFDKYQVKWNEEKENLHSKLDSATKLLQVERLKWEEEKGKLLQKLETFAKERKQWDEEKKSLLATITHADENVQYCQNLVNIYAEHNRLGMQYINSSRLEHSLEKLTEERDDLAARVDDEKSMVESYKALYDQSEEHCQYYKACFEEYEQKFRKLKEENLDISAKLFTETSFAERYKRLVNELEDKCRRLEEEKNDANAKLCAAKASSELYRSCLLDFF